MVGERYIPKWTVHQRHFSGRVSNLSSLICRCNPSHKYVLLLYYQFESQKLFIDVKVWIDCHKYWHVLSYSYILQTWMNMKTYKNPSLNFIRILLSPHIYISILNTGVIIKLLTQKKLSISLMFVLFTQLEGYWLYN